VMTHPASRHDQAKIHITTTPDRRITPRLRVSRPQTKNGGGAKTSWRTNRQASIDSGAKSIWNTHRIIYQYQ
jgi:hypothetical protein